MLRIFILLLFFLPRISYAQSSLWVKPNAVWHYDYQDVWTNFYLGFMKIEHTGDSIIQGKNALRFNFTDHAFCYNQQVQVVLLGIYPAGEMHTYADGDTVFYLQNGTFQKLFDFSKQTGESYIIGETNPDPMEQCINESWTLVTGIGADNYGYSSITLQSYPNANLRLNGTFNNRFAGDFFLPLLRSCDPNIIYEDYAFTFKCFQDDSLMLNPSGEDCEYLLNNVGLDNLNRSSFTLGPNPADQILNIKAPSDINTIEVFDTKGKLIMTQSNQGSDAIINTSSFATGLYVVKIHGHALMAPMKRFVKL
jgi:hypothetical protein